MRIDWRLIVVIPVTMALLGWIALTLIAHESCITALNTRADVSDKTNDATLQAVLRLEAKFDRFVEMHMTTK